VSVAGGNDACANRACKSNGPLGSITVHYEIS
jgi:hypothetical protein